jgi:EMC6-arch
MEIKLPTKEERIALHKRGVKMILVTVLLGVLAGILSSPYFLSQPLYAPVSQNGGEDFLSYPSVMLYHASVVTPDTSKPAGSFLIPDKSVLLGNSNSSIVLYNTSAVIPNASVRYTNAIIQAGHASLSHANSSVLLADAQVVLTDSTDIPANASVLLTNGAILLSSPADTQNATVLLSPDTSMQTNPHAPNNGNFAFLILALLIYVQKYIFPYLGIDSKRFGFKDWFFLSFMTFCFWFVTWTLLLNGPAPFFGPLF